MSTDTTPSPEHRTVAPGGSAVLASDAERERVTHRLRDAAAEGRLTLTESDERQAMAYAARTRDELTPLVADLPGTHRPSRPRRGPMTPRARRIFTVHAAVTAVVVVLLVTAWAFSPRRSSSRRSRRSGWRWRCSCTAAAPSGSRRRTSWCRRTCGDASVLHPGRAGVASPVHARPAGAGRGAYHARRAGDRLDRAGGGDARAAGRAADRRDRHPHGVRAGGDGRRRRRDGPVLRRRDRADRRRRRARDTVGGVPVPVGRREDRTGAGRDRQLGRGRAPGCWTRRRPRAVRTCCGGWSAYR